MTFMRRNTKASKLNGLKVVEIREKYAAGIYTQAQLSREYQVTIGTIRNVILGLTWQYVPMEVSDDAIADEAARIRRSPPTAEEISASEARLTLMLGQAQGEKDREDELLKLKGDST